MRQVNNLCSYAGLLHEELFTGFNDTLPKLIYKSLQILCNFENYKVVNCLIFGILIPVCYLSEVEAQPLIITLNKQ